MSKTQNRPPPFLGAILHILDEHIRSDPSFTQSDQSFEEFKSRVAEGLANKARDTYNECVDKEIPQEESTWEFHHVMELGKSVLKLRERVRKRFKKNPEILGVKPDSILSEI